MNIRLKKKREQYAQVHKNLLFHSKISIQAKGLGAIFECYSDNFTISMATLEIHSGLHRDTIRKYLKELEGNFFLFRVQIIKDCTMVWFFDSQNLDISYLIEEIEELQKYQKIRFLTAYEIFAPDKIGTDKLATYNNTINNSQNLSNCELFQLMYQVQQDKEKKGRSSEFYTDENGNRKKKQLTNSPKTIKQNDVIAF